MRIKEVCNQTGLTDRAVRLYIEEKLIEPVVTENYLGRRTLDFCPEDVRQLQDIAILRKFGFSIAQIRAIQTSPESAGFVLENARRQKQDTVDSQQRILDALGKLRIGSACTVTELADALRSTNTTDSLPEDGVEKPRYGYARMLLEMLALCAALTAGVLAVLLLTDMAVFYFRNDALTFNGQGLKTLFSRSGSYFAWLVVGAGLAIPLSYYARILWRYGRNSRKPELCARAVVVDKRQNADAVVLSSFYARNGGMICFLVFRTEDGSVLELTVPQKDYYGTAIGTRGHLVWQGSKMVDFLPDKVS